MKQKALTSSAHILDNELANYAFNIVTKMTTNPFYTDPKPNLTVFQGLITLYSAALLKSIDGSKADTANKNAARVNLQESISLLANYVNLTAENDLVKLESSGFNVSAIPTPVGILPAPNLKISFGNNPGEVGYVIEADPRASEHIILYAIVPAPENDTEWHTKVVSSAKGIITDLEHKKDYIFKATSTSSESNKRNQYNYSNPVEQYVS